MTKRFKKTFIFPLHTLADVVTVLLVEVAELLIVSVDPATPFATREAVVALKRKSVRLLRVTSPE